MLARGLRRQLWIKRGPVLLVAAALTTALTSVTWTVLHLMQDDDQSAYASLQAERLLFSVPHEQDDLPSKRTKFSKRERRNDLHLVWPERPYFFKNSSYRPPAGANRSFPLYPEEDKNDRIVEQLMFNPSLNNSETKMKSIMLTSGFDWIQPGQSAFLSPAPCPVNACVIQRPHESRQENADAVLFINTAPANPGYNRLPEQVWILYILESPPHSSGEAGPGMINWTATYRTDSDIVAPYEKWVYYDARVKKKPQRKNYAKGKTKQVAWFVSNCGAKNKRLEYARQLGNYIGVDIYGRCGNLTCTRGEEACSRMLDDEYKFYLAFENSNCKDYITEKLFSNALMHDVLPVVMGAKREDYERVAPEKSFIHVDDFASPEDLAKFLRLLDEDNDAYNEYFQWKGTGEFIDTRFLCRVCAILHDPNRKPKHYNNVQDWWRGAGICT